MKKQRHMCGEKKRTGRWDVGGSGGVSGGDVGGKVTDE